jgi:hypothetical protein
MSTMFLTTTVSEVESEGKKTYYGNSQYRKKESVQYRVIYNPVDNNSIHIRTRCKNERKDLLKKNMSECNPWLVIEYHIYSFGN